MSLIFSTKSGDDFENVAIKVLYSAIYLLPVQRGRAFLTFSLKELNGFKTSKILLDDKSHILYIISDARYCVSVLRAACRVLRAHVCV